MTSPNSPQPELRARKLRRVGTTLLVALLGVTMAASDGCAKKKKPPPPPPPPPPKVEPPPEPVDIGALIQQLHPDARVKFADGQSPADRTLAEGVIHLADMVAKGDSAGLHKMLDRPAQTVLDELVSKGDWTGETKKIEQVRVVYLSDTSERHPESAMVAIAIQDPGGAYLLGWSGKRDGDNWTFAAAPTPPDIHARASDFDGQRLATSVSSAPETMTDSSDAASPGKKPEDLPAPPTAPSDGPKKKSTPAGPITIPGSPGGG